MRQESGSCFRKCAAWWCVFLTFLWIAGKNPRRTERTDPKIVSTRNSHTLLMKMHLGNAAPLFGSGAIKSQIQKSILHEPPNLHSVSELHTHTHTPASTHTHTHTHTHTPASTPVHAFLHTLNRITPTYTPTYTHVPSYAQSHHPRTHTHTQQQ
jgi:hypothetical protein